MALQVESSAAPYSPHVVAAAFVKQYYEVLLYKQEDAYRFYTDSSILGRSDSNGNIVSVTTIDDIKRQLLSTDFTGCLVELETVDSQPSHVDGVLILVAGSFTIDAVKQKFTQSFFLAPQASGYFVLNDILRFARPSTEVEEVVANHDDESTTLPAEPATASIEGSTVPNIPPTENIMPVNDEVISPSTSGVLQDESDSVVETCVEVVNKDIEKIPEAAQAPVKDDAVVETCVKVVNKDIEKIPEAAQAPPSAEKEVLKKTYASIVKTIKEGIPLASAAKPNPKPKAAHHAEKSVPSPSKPAHATNTAPPNDKSVSKSKSSDEPGYSVFVKNLPFDATVEMVEQEFSRFGAIKPGGIQVRKYQFDRFCFGFIEFESEHSMEAAIKESTVFFGSWESYIEEKKTKTRVVDGVVTRGDDNGSRFQSGRGGFNGNGYRGHGGFRSNGSGYYSNGVRNNFRNQGPHGNGYNQDGKQGPQGNGYNQNGKLGPQGNGYNQNGNGYNQNRNGYPLNGQLQRRPYNSGGNGNGRVECSDGNGRVERSNGNGQPVAA